MLVCVVFLGVYAALLTWIIWKSHKKQSRNDVESNLINQISLTGLSASEQLEALSHLATFKQHSSPWYERSLSTIGVVAFFSMIIATGIQTVKGYNETAKSEQMQQQMGALREERQTIEELLAKVSLSVADRYTETGHLDAAGKEILEHRLKYLKVSNRPTSEELSETFMIALILRDFETARAVLRSDNHLLNTGKPSDLINLAEYEFIQDAPNTAREYLKRVNPIISTLPTSWQVRTIVLDSLLNGNEEVHAKQLSSILLIDTESAKRRLASEMARLRENMQECWVAK